MLLCLDRGQRLVYILGEILDVGDTVGAELLQIPTRAAETLPEVLPLSG